MKNKKLFAGDNVGYLLLAPSILIYFVFVFIPIIGTIGLSFTNYTLLSSPKYIGLSNYKKLLTDDFFHAALRNTIIYSGFLIVASLVLGLLFAIILDAKIFGKRTFRTIIYMPNVISVVAASMAWLYLYESVNGVFNKILKLVGIAPQQWLFDPKLALASVIVMGIWQLTGYNMIVFLAGLQGIPGFLYEAAKIDGASSLQRFWHITIPMLSPTTFFLVVMSFITSFQVFGQVYTMTGGGPMNSTTTIVHQIYKNGFEGYKMGYASAMSVVLLIIMIMITLINFGYGNKGGDREIG